MGYLGQLITCIAALIAIKGGTWDATQVGLRKLTGTGIAAVLSVVLGTIVSVTIARRSEREAKLKSDQLDAAVGSTKDAGERVRDLETQLRAYKEILGEVRDESQRQPQVVMSQYVPLRPRETWTAPNRIFPGSIVRFYGFECTLILSYGDSQDVIPPGARDARPTETVVIGRSGAEMSWRLMNGSDRPCGGKVFVESTPRTRSIDWSWVEEGK